MVSWRTFRNLSIAQKFFIEKTIISLEYLNVLYTKNCSLKGSLGNQKWFFSCEKTLFESLFIYFFYSVRVSKEVFFVPGVELTFRYEIQNKKMR